MAQSPEYPDLKWVPPKSWTDANRTSVQLIVMHTTEGSAHGQSAEDGAAYDARRTDGTSTHYFHDNTTTVQCVRTADQAHTARSQGNRRGIQHELCTRAAASVQTWANDYHVAMLRRAAKQAARDARKWGIPVRHLTVAQVAAGEKGFCGHWDITRAFPQDGGSHTDPGPNFPWSRFLDMVRAELEDDMPLNDTDLAKVKAIVEAAVDRRVGDVVPRLLADGTFVPGTDANPRSETSAVIGYLHKDLWLVKRDLGAIASRVGATSTELSAFNQRERDEVPVTLEQLRQLLEEAIPEAAGPLTPGEARAAVLGALQQAFSGDPAA